MGKIHVTIGRVTVRISRLEDSRPRYRREYNLSLGTEGILRDKGDGMGQISKRVLPTCRSCVNIS